MAPTHANQQVSKTATDTNAIRPFHVNIPQADLVDLRKRIDATKWPDRETVADYSQGIRLETIQALARYWAKEYDWRKCEARLQALPQCITEIDGLDIHFIHVRSKHEHALPLIVTHGWPGSIVEQLKIIDPLTNPMAHGGSAADAFHLVIPSMPGYGFSGKPTTTGWDAPHVARGWRGAGGSRLPVTIRTPFSPGLMKNIFPPPQKRCFRPARTVSASYQSVLSSSVSETLQQWFIREIISHEAALMRFMARVWRDRDEIADLRQETYVRVYDAAACLRPTNPRSFLFATARHLMTDRARRGKIVSIELKGDLDSLNVLIDEISPEQSIGARQELRQLAQAFDLLPAQCRDVLWMRKVEGLSQKEVASRMGINEKAVEKRLARAVRLLVEACCGDFERNRRNDKGVVAESESGNG